MSDAVCAIHQPNFFPWLGYFDKINKCDRFVILDDAQYQKTGGTWMNRVAIMIGGKKNWLTAPIIRRPGLMLINEVEFHKTNWREKTKKTLQTNYGSSIFFRDIREWLFSIIDFPVDNLSEYNINAISKISNSLGIEFKKKALLSSKLNIKSQATERLINISKAAGCSTYMAGGGADGYQDNEKFESSGMKLVYQNFTHPVYNQYKTEFVDGLSIIDAICNIGVETVGMLLTQTAS